MSVKYVQRLCKSKTGSFPKAHVFCRRGDRETRRRRELHQCKTFETLRLRPILRLSRKFPILEVETISLTTFKSLDLAIRRFLPCHTVAQQHGGHFGGTCSLVGRIGFLSIVQRSRGATTLRRCHCCLSEGEGRLGDLSSFPVV